MTIIDGQTDIFDLLNHQPPTIIMSMPDAGTFTRPGDLQAMYERREAHYRDHHVMKGNWRPYRGWETRSASGKGSEHVAEGFSANLRCNYHSGIECYCVGTYVYRVYCHGCETWTGIYGKENEAWEAHLDACWLGWRDLPVVESKTSGYSYKYNYPENYPAKFKTPGAPIRDCRGNTKYGTRHVPGTEPFGGVKVGIIRDCKLHNQKGEK